MTEQTADQQRPAGVADAPLIVEDLAQHARQCAQEGDLLGAERLAAQARELIDEVR